MRNFLALMSVLALVSACATVSPQFNASSNNLKRTQILPTLETPLPEHKNAIWCASFLAVWKTLEQKNVAGEKIALTIPSPMVDELNAAADPRSYIPKANIYSAAGKGREGIIEKIRQEMKLAFPAKELPAFPGVGQDEFVAYSYLEANLDFAVPYTQGKVPLNFKDSLGNITAIHSFDASCKARSDYAAMRRQVKILYKKVNLRNQMEEYVVDLDRASTPHQLMLALIKPEATLAATLDKLDQLISISGNKYLDSLTDRDSLAVPDIDWNILHHFSELEGRAFANASMRGHCIVEAVQETRFRMNRYGARLESQSMLRTSSIAAHYMFDRPFLIIMKLRDSKKPYFVMWVDNDELLTRWK